METHEYLRSIAYYYAIGRLDQVDPYSVGAFNVGTDFANKYADQVYGSKSVFTTWELYVKELRQFVVVDLGVGSDNDDNDEYVCPHGFPGHDWDCCRAEQDRSE